MAEVNPTRFLATFEFRNVDWKVLIFFSNQNTN